MTRDELIEVITRKLVGEDATERHLDFCRRMGTDVLIAIEAQGLAIVPVEATEAQIAAAGGAEINLERADCQSYMPASVYADMIEAARI